MTALKGRDIDAFLARPTLRSGLMLVYGPDTGLVSETAERLMATLVGEPADPESMVSLHMSEVDADPQLLGITARSPSLFGSGRFIRIRGATNKLTATLKELLDEGIDAAIVVEGGNLTPSDSLRKLAEQSRDARALPCYADTSQAIDGLIRQTFADNGIATDPDLVPMLRDMLGNDRQVTRRELEKLVLFAHESKQLTADDIVALCGDNAALATDAVVDAIATGHAKKLDDALTRAQSSGTDIGRLLILVLNHFARLRAMRAEIDAGAPAEDVVKRATPRIHFSRAAGVQQQLRLWNDDGLAAACNRIQSAIGDTRKQSALAQSIARQAMLAVCMAAARR